jgi:hypothetical protein
MEQVRMSGALMSGRIRSARALVVLLLVVSTLGFTQQPTGKSSDKSKTAADSHSLESQNVLRQMNSALEDLAARVSPGGSADSDHRVRAPE